MQEVVSHHLGENGKCEKDVDERELSKEKICRDVKMGGLPGSAELGDYFQSV